MGLLGEGTLKRSGRERTAIDAGVGRRCVPLRRQWRRPRERRGTSARIEAAAGQRVRLLATQECALSGYAPAEIESSDHVDRAEQRAALGRVQDLARKHQMYVALGMTTFAGGRARNSVRLVTPTGRLGAPYHKRALHGWDEANYAQGDQGGSGVHMVDGVRIGLRICYEVRFPEYFRELFRRRVSLSVVSFADVGAEKRKFDVMTAHLVSRAAENAMYVLSANSVSQAQGAPTCLVDPDGTVVSLAPRNREALITGVLRIEPPPFGRRGRIEHSERLTTDKGLRVKP